MQYNNNVYAVLEIMASTSSSRYFDSHNTRFLKAEPQQHHHRVTARYNPWIYVSLGVIPAVASVVCAVYVVLFYHYIVDMSTTTSHIDDLIIGMNTSSIGRMLGNLDRLEQCVLRLPICT